MQMYDHWLVHRAINGDKAAFGTLYDRHMPRVYNLLRRLTGETCAAEDLAQETFVTAWKSLKTWQKRGSLSTWLCGIAVNHYRTSRRTVYDHAMLDETTPAPLDTNPLAHLTRREAASAVDKAIAELPPLCREAFVLVRVEEMAYKEAAMLLGVPLGTLQSRLARATRLLQTSLAPVASPERSEPCPATPKM